MYTEQYRYVSVPASGTVTIGLECSNPYKNYTAWVFCGSMPTLSVQPKFGGVNDGAAVVVNAVGPKKVFQVAVDEVRPSTHIIATSPHDESAPPSLKSELAITNNALTSIMVGVYMLATQAGAGK